MKFEIEAEEFKLFLYRYAYNGFPHQRLGQAFYNHFGLHKMNKSPELALALDKIYEEKDPKKAKAMILGLFEVK